MGKLVNIWDYAVSQIFDTKIKVQDQTPDNTISKSLGDNVHAKEQSWLIDIINASTQMQFKETVSDVTYSTLRKISRKNPIIAAIINTRVNQVASFSRQVDVFEFSSNKPIGFRVVSKRKPQDKLTKAEKDEAMELEDFLSLCGYTDRFRSGRKRDKFGDFLKKITRDRLVFDQMNFEKVPNKVREPAEFHAVDPGTIRLASEKDMDRGIGSVQVVQGQIVNEYKWDEMAFCVANPVSDINQYGYGFSEQEQLISIITALFYSESYNMKFFSQGLGVQGILNMVTKDGAIPDDLMQAFRVQFQAQAAGVNNAWKTPITNADTIEWINLKPNNRDMEFVKWVDYLIKVATAVYQIAPEEINFESRSSGNSSMFESNPEGRLKYSKDKGLRPLLSYISDCITEELIEPYTSDYMCIFVGLDEKSEKEVTEIRKTEVESYKKLNEVRGEGGLAPLTDEEGGNIILNPQYITWLNQKAMAESMQSMNGGSNFSEQNQNDKMNNNNNKNTDSKPDKEVDDNE